MLRVQGTGNTPDISSISTIPGGHAQEQYPTKGVLWLYLYGILPAGSVSHLPKTPKILRSRELKLALPF